MKEKIDFQKISIARIEDNKFIKEESISSNVKIYQMGACDKKAGYIRISFIDKDGYILTVDWPPRRTIINGDIILQWDFKDLKMEAGKEIPHNCSFEEYREAISLRDTNTRVYQFRDWLIKKGYLDYKNKTFHFEKMKRECEKENRKAEIVGGEKPFKNLYMMYICIHGFQKRV